MKMIIGKKHLLIRAAYTHKSLGELLPSKMGFNPIERHYQKVSGNLAYSYLYYSKPLPVFVNVRLNEDSPITLGTDYNFLFTAISEDQETCWAVMKDFHKLTCLRLAEDYPSKLEKTCAQALIPVFDFLFAHPSVSLDKTRNISQHGS